MKVNGRVTSRSVPMLESIHESNIEWLQEAEVHTGECFIVSTALT